MSGHLGRCSDRCTVRRTTGALLLTLHPCSCSREYIPLINALQLTYYPPFTLARTHEYIPLINALRVTHNTPLHLILTHEYISLVDALCGALQVTVTYPLNAIINPHYTTITHPLNTKAPFQPTLPPPSHPTFSTHPIIRPPPLATHYSARNQKAGRPFYRPLMWVGNVN